jgi:AraC family transcriptional regulator
LSHRAGMGVLDTLEAEEGVIAIVAGVIRLAYGQREQPVGGRPSSVTRRRAIADAARAHLFETLAEHHSVHDIAAAVGTSPFHLCRVFHAHVGRTLHRYRTELRVRVGLEALERASARGATLSGIAHGLGFASHPHFTDVMRRVAGVTPRGARALVGSRVIPLNRIEQ